MTLTLSPEQERNQTNDSVVDSILSAVTDVTDTDPLELPPLYEAVDGEALTALCDTSRTTTPLTAKFEYAGCLVTVQATEEVEISVEEI